MKKRKMKTKPQLLMEKYDRMISKRRDKLRNVTEKLEKEIDGLTKLSFKQSMILSDRKKRFQDRCKHIGMTYKRWNARDDASFQYWVFCSRCQKDIGCIEHDGNYKKWDHD